MVEIEPWYYEKALYIETASGNKVSRDSSLSGSQNIVLNGKTILKARVMIRGDLASIRIGKYCIMEDDVLLRPAYKKFSKGAAFCPLHIGDHVFIDQSAIVNAAQVGSYIHIGKRVIVGKRCILRDCCHIMDDAVLSPDTVVPPFAIMAGHPAKIIGELPFCTQLLMTDATTDMYNNSKPKPTV